MVEMDVFSLSAYVTPGSSLSLGSIALRPSEVWTCAGLAPEGLREPGSPATDGRREAGACSCVLPSVLADEWHLGGRAIVAGRKRVFPVQCQALGFFPIFAQETPEDALPRPAALLFP